MIFTQTHWEHWKKKKTRVLCPLPIMESNSPLPLLPPAPAVSHCHVPFYWQEKEQDIENLIQAHKLVRTVTTWRSYKREPGYPQKAQLWWLRARHLHTARSWLERDSSLGRDGVRQRAMKGNSTARNSELEREAEVSTRPGHLSIQSLCKVYSCRDLNLDTWLYNSVLQLWRFLSKRLRCSTSTFRRFARDDSCATSHNIVLVMKRSQFIILSVISLSQHLLLSTSSRFDSLVVHPFLLATLSG